MANLKGFIKDKNGNIILPISRGELIFDVSGNCAFHSEDFKALPEDANSTEYPNGRYGLMRPADLKDIADAKAKIATIESQIGGSGETSIATEIANLKLRVTTAEDNIKNLRNNIGAPTDGIAEGSPNNTIYALINAINSNIGSLSDFGTTTVYGYINSKINEALTSALQYKGTLSYPDKTEGYENSDLPDITSTSVTNGDVYKVTVKGKYRNLPTDRPYAKEGDMFIAVKEDGKTLEWTFIPSADEIWLKVDNTPLLEGEVTIAGSFGIGVTVSNKTITISGAGLQGAISADLSALEERVGDLETDVTNLKNKNLNLEGRLSTVENTLGKESEGTVGEVDYKEATGIIKDVRDLQDDVTHAVTTPKDLTNESNGNNLVRASAVAKTAINLASHISAYEAKVNEIESKYLYAETLYGDEQLTATQKAYLILSNKPITPIE